MTEFCFWWKTAGKSPMLFLCSLGIHLGMAEQNKPPETRFFVYGCTKRQVVSASSEMCPGLPGLPAVHEMHIGDAKKKKYIVTFVETRLQWFHADHLTWSFYNLSTARIIVEPLTRCRRWKKKKSMSRCDILHLFNVRNTPYLRGTIDALSRMKEKEIYGTV